MFFFRTEGYPLASWWHPIKTQFSQTARRYVTDLNKSYHSSIKYYFMSGSSYSRVLLKYRHHVKNILKILTASCTNFHKNPPSISSEYAHCERSKHTWTPRKILQIWLKKTVAVYFSIKLASCGLQTILVMYVLCIFINSFVSSHLWKL